MEKEKDKYAFSRLLYIIEATLEYFIRLLWAEFILQRLHNTLVYPMQ